jgi:hypothetical protein
MAAIAVTAMCTYSSTILEVIQSYDVATILDWQ